MHTTPRNVVALDQEGRGLIACVNGSPTEPFDVATGIAALPAGGGWIVADVNSWSVRNELSASQFCFPDTAALETFLKEAAAAGWRCMSVTNHIARSLYTREGLPQTAAALALHRYVHRQVTGLERCPRRPGIEAGRTVASSTAPGALACGCVVVSGHLDAGRLVTVGERRGDNSQGMRRRVTVDFLRLQNDGGYESGFAQDVITIAWNGLDSRGKDLFHLKKRTPTCDSPNRLMAVAVATHDPATGAIRTYQGRPWGRKFIVHNILGLNGRMKGSGASGAGSPMRAVLRILGRRHGDRIDVAERAELDRYVRDLVRLLQQHPRLRPAT